MTISRNQFITSIITLMGLSTLKDLHAISNSLKEDGDVMPIIFFGHGSPMNAIEDNEFTKGWKEIVSQIPVPKMILCVSAHWETKGTFVTAMDKPATIHDFGGFPQALFDVQYPAPGDHWLAEEIKRQVKTTNIGLDMQWGLDHGTWSVLKQAFPAAEVPVVQLSLDYTKDASVHYALAKELQGLRKKGVLIIGSGNMVHNFQYAQFKEGFNEHYGLDWALEANGLFVQWINEKNHKAFIDYKSGVKAVKLAAPTPEHFLPLLYILALQNQNEVPTFFNNAVVGGSFSMTSVMFK